MMQQINLYNPVFLKRNPAWEPGALLAYAVLAVMLISFGASALLRAKVVDLDTRVTAVEGQIKAEQEKSQSLAAQKAARVRDPALEVQVTRLESVLRIRTESQAALNGGALGSTTGFSGHMRALARQPVSGLWLTGFSIAEGGAEVALRGRMLDAALLPRFLERLGAEKVFEGKGFKTLVIGPPAAAGGAAAGADIAVASPSTQSPSVPPPFLAFEIATRETAERAAPARAVPAVSAGARQ